MKAKRKTKLHKKHHTRPNVLIPPRTLEASNPRRRRVDNGLETFATLRAGEPDLADLRPIESDFNREQK